MVQINFIFTALVSTQTRVLWLCGTAFILVLCLLCRLIIKGCFQLKNLHQMLHFSLDLMFLLIELSQCICGLLKLLIFLFHFLPNVVDDLLLLLHLILKFILQVCNGFSELKIILG